MNLIEVKNYNLDKTLSSGQTFVWEKKGKTWYGSTSLGLIKLEQPTVNEILWQTFPVLDNFELVNEYLRLDFDFQKFIDAIEIDTHLEKALKQHEGLRLLKQDFHETVLSFIISANKNIPAIKSSIKKLSRLYGKKLEIDNETFFLFPSLEKFAGAKLEDLRSCSLGYRTEYISETANFIIGNPKDINNLNEDDARKFLVSLKGVGDKVADCVLTFGLAFDDVTPLDLWAKRVLSQFYGVDETIPYKDLRVWVKNKFNGYSAWAGQYLFEYIRSR